LPTEAEWYCLRDKIPTDLTTWQQAPGNINLEYFASSCPVDKFSTAGFFDIIGNVWQWTESEIDGFDGFSVHPLYDDFSTPTFDGRHNLFKGGSWISTGNEALKSSRYAFRRHFVQHAGFRYVESDSAEIPKTPVNQYETNTDVCQQLEAHFGATSQKYNYQQQLADYVLSQVNQHKINANKLLDIGCSVGRTTFALAKFFEQLAGVDFSARYIQHAVRCQSGQSVRFEIPQQGEIVAFNEFSLTDIGITNADNILFSQGDPSNLKPVFTGYDVVLAQQILEQSYHPNQFLSSIHQRMNSNGLLVIVSDYHFDETITPKDKWLGGIKVNGENVTGFASVKQTLAQHFNFIEATEIEKVLKVNARKYHHSLMHVTVWQRKA
jgi:putative 4-mercaptohistidine N1-methyltranferase